MSFIFYLPKFAILSSFWPQHILFPLAEILSPPIGLTPSHPSGDSLKNHCLNNTFFEHRCISYIPTAVQLQTHPSIFFDMMLRHYIFQNSLSASSYQNLSIGGIRERLEGKGGGVEKGLYSVCLLFLSVLSQQWQFISAAVVGSRHHQLSTLTESTSDIQAAARCVCSSKV